jgi:hypothetical protein
MDVREAGRRGGKKRSEAKTIAAITNGQLAGRPVILLAEPLSTNAGDLAAGVRVRSISRVGARWRMEVSLDEGLTWRRRYSDVKPAVTTSR